MRLILIGCSYFNRKRTPVGPSMTQPATRVSGYLALNESQSYWRLNKNHQWPFPFFVPRYLVVPGGRLTSREPTTKRQKCRTEVVEKGWGLALKASQRAQAIFSSSEPAPGIPKSEHRTILNLIYSHPPMAATDLSHFFFTPIHQTKRANSGLQRKVWNLGAKVYLIIYFK